MLSTGLLFLIVALKGTTEFKETRFYCSDYNYTYEVEGKPQIYIVVKSVDYVTEYTDQQKLLDKVEKECPNRSN